MGKVKVNLVNQDQVFEQAFDLSTPEGVMHFLERIHEIHELARNGNIEASLILIDIEEAMHSARLSYRERDILFYLYEKQLTQKEVARLLGISIQRVNLKLHDACRKISFMLGDY